MDKMGTGYTSSSSVPSEKEASDMNRQELELDQALADLYSDTPPLRFEHSWRMAVRREEQTQMKKKNIWKTVVLPVAAALVLVIGAGWAGQMEGEWNAAVKAPQESRSAKVSNGNANYSYTTAASGGTSGAGLMMASTSRSDADYAVEESADYEAAYDSMAMDTGAEKGASGVQLAAEVERKLIRTVDISLRTETFDADVDGIQQLLNQHGGYVESIYQHGEAGSVYGRSASLTMRVPAEQLDAFLTGMEAYGRITSRSETTEDMTEQYSDNEVRIQTLNTTLERLNTLLSQAESVSDILEIESEIADTQYELDLYQSRQLNIDRRVDMSYVYVNIQETVAQDDADDEELTLGQRLKAALKASIEGLGRFGRNLLVFLVMAAPVILPVAAVLLIIWLVKRSRKGKAEARDLQADLQDDAAADDTNEENE